MSRENDRLTTTIQRDSHQSVNAVQATGNAKLSRTATHRGNPPAARQYDRYVPAVTGPCSTCSSATNRPVNQLSRQYVRYVPAVTGPCSTCSALVNHYHLLTYCCYRGVSDAAPQLVGTQTQSRLRQDMTS